MSRFWPDGIAVHVTLDAAAAPAQIVWQQRAQTVAAVVRRWRVDQGWWRRRAWREYFIVQTRRGLLLELYRDVADGGWYVQRLYD